MRTTHLASAAVLALVGAATAQTTVDYTTAAWKDFGFGADFSPSGNFHPGWTEINGSVDVGGNTVLGLGNQTLSGAANDLGVWMNHFGPDSPLSVQNEVAGLSLSGFSVGQTYELSFFATIKHNSSSGWSGNNQPLTVAISGANISTFDTSVLSDPINNDNLNDWVAQSIVFVAQAGTVEFEFGTGNNLPNLQNFGHRFGIDGFDARLVPAPSAAALLAIGVMGATRRRRS